MLDHGQLGPPTPAMAITPSGSRRPSMNDPLQQKSCRPSINVTVSRRPSTGQLRSRVNSRGENGPLSSANFGRGLSDQLSMSALGTDDEDQFSGFLSRRSSVGGAARSGLSMCGENCPLSVADLGRGLSDSLSMSALETDEDNQISSSSIQRPSSSQPRSRVNSGGDNHPPALTGFGRGLSVSLSMSALDTDEDDDHIDGMHIKARSKVSSMADSRPTRSSAHENSDPLLKKETESIETGQLPARVIDSVTPHTPYLSTPTNPSDIFEQLQSNPKLAGHRSPRLVSQVQAIVSPLSPPILVNPKCSGYFVEPVSVVRLCYLNIR